MAPVVSRTIEICVFTFDGDTPRFLLLRRAPEEKLYPGIWQFVTGCIEEREKASDAALRELAEETGFTPSGFWVVPFVNSFYDPLDDCVNCSPLFAAQVDAGLTPRLSGEHCDYGWFTYEEAVRKLVWPGQKKGMEIVQGFILRDGHSSQLVRIR